MSKPTKDDLRKVAVLAEAGDVTADAIRRDMTEDAGYPVEPEAGLQKGHVYQFLTATHFFRGRVLAENHEFYLLAPPVHMTFETGPMSEFTKPGGKGTTEEAINRPLRIPKGGLIAVIDAD